MTGTGAEQYDKAVEFLGMSPPDEGTAYSFLEEAADNGHWKAKRQVCDMNYFTSYNLKITISKQDFHNLIKNIVKTKDFPHKFSIYIFFVIVYLFIYLVII